MDKELQKARARRSLVLLEKTYDHYPPLWVGSGELESQKLQMIKSRKDQLSRGPSGKSDAKELARTLGNMAVFWLSHAAVGLVSIPSVLGHLLGIIRLVDEFDLLFASKYELHLQRKLQELIKTRGDDMDISDRIVVLDSGITAELRLTAKAPRAVPSKGDPVTPTKANKGKGKGSGKAATPSRAPPAAQTTPQKSSAPAKGGTKGVRNTDRICFDHDPSRSSVCSRGRSCQHTHLDTRQPDLLIRFDRAVAASAAARAARANSGR